MTYYDAVCSNIELLRVIGLLHPRLALLGIDSEMEIVIREILPRCDYEFMLRKLPVRTGDYTHLDLECMAMPPQRWDIDNILPRDLKPVFGRLREMANCCRHSRFLDIDSQTVSHCADKALAFIDFLAHEKYFSPIRAFSSDCANCPPKSPESNTRWRSADTWLVYSLLEVFRLQLGSTMELHCYNCDEVLLTLEIPCADEATRWINGEEDIVAQLRQLAEDPEKK